MKNSSKGLFSQSCSSNVLSSEEKKILHCFLNKQTACRYSFSSPCCSDNNPIFSILITAGALGEKLLLQQMSNQNCIAWTLCAEYVLSLPGFSWKVCC